MCLVTTVLACSLSARIRNANAAKVKRSHPSIPCFEEVVRVLLSLLAMMCKEGTGAFFQQGKASIRVMKNKLFQFRVLGTHDDVFVTFQMLLGTLVLAKTFIHSIVIRSWHCRFPTSIC